MSKACVFFLGAALCTAVCATVPNDLGLSSASPSVWKAYTYFSLGYLNDDNHGSFDDPNSDIRGGVTMARNHYYVGFMSDAQDLFKKSNRNITHDFAVGILNHYGKSLRYNLVLDQQLWGTDVDSNQTSLSAALLWRNVIGFGYQYSLDQDNFDENDTTLFAQHTFGATKQNWAALGYQHSALGGGASDDDYYAQYRYRLKPTSAWYVGAFYIHQQSMGLNIVGFNLQHGLNFIHAEFLGDIFRRES
jgi:hypothetical protein